jgi:hypothetical protein
MFKKIGKFISAVGHSFRAAMNKDFYPEVGATIGVNLGDPAGSRSVFSVDTKAWNKLVNDTLALEKELDACKEALENEKQSNIKLAMDLADRNTTIIRITNQLKVAEGAFALIECLANDTEFLTPVDIKRTHEAAQNGYRATQKPLSE